MKKISKRKRYELTFDPIIDKKIIDHLERIPNRAQYVRNLIVEDIKKRPR